MQSVVGKWTVNELLRRCSAERPDEEAWREFVRRYHGVIRAYVVKTFNQKLRHEADRKARFPDDLIEDLVQLVYLKLLEDGHRALARFVGEHENSIFQYLTIISVNVVRDYFREAAARKRPRVSYSLDQLMEAGAESGLLEESLRRADLNPFVRQESRFTFDEIERALARVVSRRNRDRDTLIFKLRFYEELTHEEIIEALRLDMTAVGVGSVINRIVGRLKQVLDRVERRDPTAH